MMMLIQYPVQYVRHVIVFRPSLSVRPSVKERRNRATWVGISQRDCYIFFLPRPSPVPPPSLPRPRQLHLLVSDVHLNDVVIQSIVVEPLPHHRGGLLQGSLKTPNPQNFSESALVLPTTSSPDWATHQKTPTHLGPRAAATITPQHMWVTR